MLVDIIAWAIVVILLSPIIVPTLIIVFTLTIGPVYALVVGLAQRK